MRLRISNADERVELLRYLRANGCIAYVVDEEQDIEVLLLQSTSSDGGVIMALVDAWRAPRLRARFGSAG